MRPKYILDGKAYEVFPVRHARTLTLNIDGRNVDVEFQRCHAHRYELVMDGCRFACHTAQSGPDLFIQLDNGASWCIQVADSFEEASSAAPSSGAVRASMPGAVVEIPVSQGDRVDAGSVVMVIESMKLLVELQAPIKGVVKSVGYSTGDTFTKGAVLLEIVDSNDE